MKTKLKEALQESVQDLVDLGAKVKFTKKELNELGIRLPKIEMNTKKIQSIRKSLNLSQAVFAELLNVSLSSVRQWEIGARNPTGSTKVLLELLEKDLHALDFRLKNRVA